MVTQLTCNSSISLSSLSDRKPVESEDEIVIMIVPDYQMLQYVQKIASSLSDDPVRILLSLLKTHPFTLTGKTVG